MQMSKQSLAMDTEDRSSIPAFYADRSIFITGGSGFMGKVLIEKLLRSCPDLRTLFLLLRVKKGKTPDERVHDITNDRLFDRLRKEQPDALLKLRVVEGDVGELGLGLREEDRRLLQREVSVVFHSAASVRFDDSLRDAVLVNVRGTRELLELAQQMPRLEVFLHLSTIYCNCNQSVIEEKIYPAPGSWQKMIRLVEETADENLIHALTPKIIGSLPNTYVYAKALSEQMVNDYQEKLPVLIVRPSIVAATATEPLVGWIDNLNGPMGIWMGVYTGVLRVVYVDMHQRLDYVTVDNAIKSMVFLAWHRALNQPRSLDVMPVYNCCSMITPMTHRKFSAFSQSHVKNYPTMKSLWFPPTESALTTNYAYYFLCVILFHMLPAALLDCVIKAVGRKPMFVKLYRRIFIANTALSYFSTREFQFSNTEFLATERFMLPSDKDQFSYVKIVEWDEKTFAASLILARELILKDPLSTFKAAKKRWLRLYLLDRGLKGGFLLVVAWVLANSAFVHSAIAALCSLATRLFGSETQRIVLVSTLQPR